MTPDVVCNALPFITWIETADGTHSAAESSSHGAGMLCVNELFCAFTAEAMSTALIAHEDNQWAPFESFFKTGETIINPWVMSINLVVVTTVYGPTGRGNPGSMGSLAFKERINERAWRAVSSPPKAFFTVAPVPGASTRDA
jgi:hypothetical protein